MSEVCKRMNKAVYYTCSDNTCDSPSYDENGAPTGDDVNYNRTYRWQGPDWE